MDPLLQSSLEALREPSFRQLFGDFLVLQRYDLTPYVHHFRTLPDEERTRRGLLTVSGTEVSAQGLVERFLDFLAKTGPDDAFEGVAEGFWRAFPDVIGGRGPRECLAARSHLERDYERNFMMPLLSTPLRALAPRRVLDFGCGLNRLAGAMQEDFRVRGEPAPTVTGVDIELRPGAVEDLERGISLRRLHGPSLAAVVEVPADLVIAKYVLHHMDPVAQARLMSEVAAVLAPGGRLLVLEAAVETDAMDRESFATTSVEHPAWPLQAWAEPYRAWSTRFYRASARDQRHLMCLEDTFGHVLLSGPGPVGAAPMPLPYSYLGRVETTRLAAEAGLELDRQLSVALGLPPLLKYGPPTSVWVFRRTAPGEH